MASDGDARSDRDAFEPFALVGNETRAAALRALAEHQRESPTDPYLSFSELRNRCGIRDSGKFNYHLGRMEGTLVEKSGDGYKLSFRGFRAVGALVGGAFDTGLQRGPDPLPGDCPFCGDELTATYEGGAFRVTCGSNHTFQQDILPSAIEDKDLTEAASLMTYTLHQDLQMARRGVCAVCNGRTEAFLERVDGPFEEPAFRSICSRCGAAYTGTPGAPLALHPAVVSFYYDHGVDLREVPFWDLDIYGEESVETVGEDPLSVRVEVELDGEALRLTLDENMTVVAEERTPV